MTDHAEAITQPTWCAGCDNLHPVGVMGWTADGLYRCHATPARRRTSELTPTAKAGGCGTIPERNATQLIGD
jgi:hypothetical protein